MKDLRKKLFLAMPVRSEYEAVYEIVKQAGDLAQVEVIRVDQILFAGSIVSHIYQQINEADLVVAVLSEENGNVYYEVGLAHSQGKPVIILTSDVSKLKFDLKDHRAIVYDLKHKKTAVNMLTKVISSVLNIPTDAVTYLSGSYSGISTNPSTAYEKGLEKAQETVIQHAELQRPVEVTQMTYVDESSEYAIEWRDFMQKRVRAIIDINGVIRNFKRIDQA